jgi:hypothetical protein
MKEADMTDPAQIGVTGSAVMDRNNLSEPQKTEELPS